MALAMALGVGIWMTGFVWGSVVFMTPALQVSAIPWVSSNPAISGPIPLAWLPLTYVTARWYLRRVGGRAAEARRLGAVLAGTNLLLDAVLLVGALGAGFQYFESLSVWTAYALLALVPRLAVR
jgi:hypothetical protein